MKCILGRKRRKKDPISLRDRTHHAIIAEQRLALGKPAQITICGNHIHDETSLLIRLPKTYRNRGESRLSQEKSFR